MSLPTLSAAPGSLAHRVLESRKVRRWLPRNLRRGDPVLQFFLNAYGKTTRYTFVNFPSLYSPATAHPCLYDLVLRDASGTIAGRASIEVPVAGTAASDNSICLLESRSRHDPRSGRATPCAVVGPTLRGPVRASMTADTAWTGEGVQ